MKMARKNTLEQKRDRRLQKLLTAYSVAAGAALALASPADAAIVQSGPQNISLDYNNPTFAIDIDGGGVNDVSIFGATHGWGSTINPGLNQVPNAAGTAILGTTGAIKIQGGTGISINNFIRVAGKGAKGNGTMWYPGPGNFVKNWPLSNYIPRGTSLYWKLQGTLNGAKLSGGAYGGGYPMGYGLFDGTLGNIGVKFKITDATAPLGFNYHLGVIAYEGDNNNAAGTILSWAYDDNPTATQIHATPLPSTFGLMLLALGATGVVRLRQRKKEAQEETA